MEMDKLQRRTNEEMRKDSWPEVLPEKISVWHIVGGAALVGLAALVIVNIPDIKRYIRISTM
jgi:hypothetical protein